ncbi:AbrB/MazE/SpoVT family DNA-binding domain-containing protein [Breznakiella homolactica]|uniref:AbrB/MazE/SpoVT family DNA-binding domain-containing protein n=1 Tax=Breznakiella homolactica TaxID=2798577 RepID=A0A7T7XQ15_9SPIR|nr:AbrB/MazE/SpoVT family DNA-binding domain-containing protein [Breznakiella homolactica]QQO10391.1 AbrB/MazE/SpoVT family DNA-binding domain-containing protein [Breznakiella homolactica]
MEIAKVTSKGQITIPQDIREELNIKQGDKIIFFKENGKYYLENSSSVALKVFQKEMKGASKEAGFKDSDDVVKYVKDIRKKK